MKMIFIDSVVKGTICLRSVYKPHFVKQAAQVYALTSVIPADPFRRSSIYAVYPRFKGAGRSVVSA